VEMRLLTLLLILFLQYTRILSWRQWNYSVTHGSTFSLWDEEWSTSLLSNDTISAPRPRRGHTLVAVDHYVILFGGRGNSGRKQHIPRTYNVVKVN
jgi:hypothetical protein